MKKKAPVKKVPAQRPSRSEALLVRMTSGQKTAWIHAAVGRNMDLSAWIRLVCDAAAEQLPPRQP